MTSRTAANRYARALLDVAIQETARSAAPAAVNDALRQIEAQLDGFARLVAEHRDLQEVLISPAVPASRKHAAVAAVAERGRVAPVLARLLVLLADRDRLGLIPEVLAAYRERLLDHFKVVRAEVTTAVALAEGQAKALEQRLAEVTGRTVTLAAQVDPSIIGGVVTRIGSTVYDGSVTRQLQKMKERLIAGV